MPKVSIIITIYNIDKYLPQCLDSVINQTLTDIEIICVDDGSTDKSLSILNDYALKDSRIRILNQKNQGPGVARNNAINIAVGEYIMILDPDDWLEINACELAYKKISQNNNDIVFFGLQRFYEKNQRTVIDTNKLKPFVEVMGNQKIDLSNLQNDYLKTAYTTCQIYSTKFLKENSIKYSETYLCEDIVFMVSAVISAKSIAILDAPIYNYRIRENSMSSSLKRHWQDLLINRQIALNIIQTHEKEMDFIYPYLIYLLNSNTYWFKQISVKCPKFRKSFYTQMRSLYLSLSSKYEIKRIAPYVNLRAFQDFCKLSWRKYYIKEILKNTFEITNTKKHKILTIFGKKFKFQLRKKVLIKRVITYGTYDILHYGHINLLKRARELGDYLIVVLSSDEFNQLKGKKSYYTYDQRKKMLEACKFVDLVIPEHYWEQKISDVQKYQVDIFVMGDDWKGKFDFLKEYCEVIYLPRTPGISTTQIKEYLKK